MNHAVYASQKEAMRNELLTIINWWKERPNTLLTWCFLLINIWHMFKRDNTRIDIFIENKLYIWYFCTFYLFLFLYLWGLGWRGGLADKTSKHLDYFSTNVGKMLAVHLKFKTIRIVLNRIKVVSISPKAKSIYLRPQRSAWQDGNAISRHLPTRICWKSGGRLKE